MPASEFEHAVECADGDGHFCCQERQAFAHKLVDTTDRRFTFATAQGSFADFVRSRIFPIFVRVAYDISSVRKFMFRTLSQTMLNCHESSLNEGKAGKVKGGDRLPWLQSHGADDYGPLSAIGRQVHVYGTARADLRA